ncbi:MAG: permease-like cell division protein FtsX [Pseudanabaenaceae cyanobacterium bins.68]|nr:permease-like cell division protein FtsX [Pseudanabaenaceae cyanobacterium bins.68]
MVKIWTKFGYLLDETALGIRRGGWMNWAAVSTVTILLFLLSIGLQVSWQLDHLLSQMGNQLEISAYVTSYPDNQPTSLLAQIQQISGVSSVRLIPKDQAWSALLQELGSEEVSAATQQLGGNPLLDQVKVSTADPKLVPVIAERIRLIKGLEDIWYLGEVVNRVGQLRQGLNQVGLMVVGLLTGVAIAVINTTIRLIVMARRREIEIMQLVGATRAWIYFPFVLQGIFFGLAGAIAAYILQQLCVSFVAELWLTQPELIRSLGMGFGQRSYLILPLGLVTFGSGVGVIGSLFAVRKFSVG